MDLIVVGQGRAGGSLTLAARAAGHDVVGVLSRNETGDYGPLLAWDTDLPATDLVLIAVTDGAVAEVAARIAPHITGKPLVAHVSGFVSLEALEPIRSRGLDVGSFHPLQTLPEPVRGADALAGSTAAITGVDTVVDVLAGFARSLGMEPMRIADHQKPAYHAAAAAAANFVVTSLAVAADLLDSADVPLDAVRPLVRQVIDNAFEVGPENALTGPIARGDFDTVRGQLAAATAVSEELGVQFRLLAEATARRAGRDPADLAE